MFIPSAFVGPGIEVTAVVACDVAVEEAAVLEESDDRVLVWLGISLMGDLGVGSSRPPAESLVFFFLRRLPKVGIGAEKGG